MYLSLHLQRVYGPRPARRRRRWILLPALLILLLVGCGENGEEDPAQLGEGARLAARLPTDDALNIAIVDVDSVRRSIGMGPRTVPPTGSNVNDQKFLGETNPALGIVQSGNVPNPIADELVSRAHFVASVTGDRAVTAISTSAPPGSLEEMLRSSGLEEQDDATWVAPDEGYAIAIGDGLIAVAETTGDARSVIERNDGKIPRALEDIVGDGQLVTLARFGANCVDSIGTSDSVHRPGEVSFFTSASPDATRVTSREEPPRQARVDGDSARVSVHAADDPSEEPPALKALESGRIDYDCGG